ncbi:hypothetical protein LR48_Vigan02g069100 [Vigna angularis]|uniref:Putative plant transposon protein domain-containing protein n=1 Tax=Phaseolus angularis TaxID=3914 RepID=A0A0L9TVN8_PHAAN|nr:hypothetical protein LR48_Vigan02g069100 [Vigna angularis]
MNNFFFRTQGFLFQEWLFYSSLTKFVELEGDYYPNLVKVFYTNLKAERNCLVSKVKGVTINIVEAIWGIIAGFQSRGLKSHLGITSLNKVNIYNDCLRNPNMVGNYDSFCIDHLSKDERVCASVITLILLLRSKDQSLLTTKDVYLLNDLRIKIHTNWASVIVDRMLKVTSQNEYHLPYAVFISQVLRFHGVDVTNEITIGCTKRNVIEKLFLDHIGLRRNVYGWSYKDEYHLETKEAELINVDTSRHRFIPPTDFEKFVVDQFKRHDNKMSKLHKSLSKIHRKMDYASMINAFGGSLEDESQSEKNNADEKLLKMSDS